MKDVVSKLAMVAAALLFGGIIFSKDFRLALGLAIDPLLSPLATLKFHLTVFLLSIVTGVYSNIIQKYTIDHKKLKRIQEVIRKYQKEYMEAMKQNNQFKLKQLEKKKNEMQQLQSEMMSMQFKPMSYTLLVSIPIFAWLWEKAVASYEILFGAVNAGGYGNITQNLPEAYVKALNPDLFYVVAPFMGKIHVTTPVLIFPWWLFWYILCSIMVSQVVKKVLKVGV